MPVSNLRQRIENFTTFGRNGKWGTCVDCPQDSSSHKYPEFCPNTNRYDHQLTSKELYEWWNRVNQPTSL